MSPVFQTKATRQANNVYIRFKKHSHNYFIIYNGLELVTRSIVRLSNTGFSFSLTYSTDIYVWRVYYNRQVMLTTRGLLITLLFWGRCLCIKYFGIVNVKMTYEFGFMIWVLGPLGATYKFTPKCSLKLITRKTCFAQFFDQNLFPKKKKKKKKKAVRS